MSIRVLIADDQPIVRTGLTMLLDAQPDIEVVGAAADGREAVRLALQLRPDVGLFDIRMPLMDGIEATRRLSGPDVTDPLPIVVITTFDPRRVNPRGAQSRRPRVPAQGRRTRPADPGHPRRRRRRRTDRTQRDCPTARSVRPRTDLTTEAAGRTAHRPRGGSPRACSPRPHQP